MKAPNFAYVKPHSVAEVFDALERYGTEAKILAGGQSLLPALNMRLAAPSVLVDINGLTELAGISIANDTLRVGALTRHCEVERSAEIAAHAPLIRMAIAHVAHPAVRNRGTLGGSIAYADPAAELPACAVALDAIFVLASRSGERRIRAEEFFTGLYETALRPDELLVAAEFPANRSGHRSAFQEITRRHGDFAIVGLAARANAAAGRGSDVRLVFFGVGTTPVIARSTAAVLDGCAVSPALIAEAHSVLDRDIEPYRDLYSSADTKRRLARVLLKRALHTLATEPL